MIMRLCSFGHGVFLLLLLLVVIACKIELVTGSGSIDIELLKYINLQKNPNDPNEIPKGRRRDGYYCDNNIFGRRTSQCDHYFHICIDRLNSPNTLRPCIYYNGGPTTPVKNQDVIDFKRDRINPALKRTISHKMLANFRRDLSIKIAVYDDDTGHDDDVDFLRLDLNYQGRNQLASNEPKIFNITSRTTMMLKVTLRCGRDWYGLNCNVLCLPAKPRQYYNCDPRTGDKVCEPGYTGPRCEIRDSNGPRIIDCDVIHKKGYDSGFYNIELGTYRYKVEVYCQMTPQGGWTYLMYRGRPGRLSFDRDWAAYKDGFGTTGPDSEHWIGLEAMRLLTEQGRYQLHVDMTTVDGSEYYAQYSRFEVGSETSNYNLTVTGYSGNSGDALEYHNGMPFSTFDDDNDYWYRGNCAADFRSGWWFNKCFNVNLCGVFRFPRDGCPEGMCIQWRTLDRENSLEKVSMKIIPYRW